MSVTNDAINLLAIENDSVTQKSPVRFLSDFPVSVTRETSYLRAVNVVNSSHVDIVFLDTMLFDGPKFDVIVHEFLESLRTPIPVVVLSTFSRHELRTICLNQGASDYLCKSELSQDVDVGRVLWDIIERIVKTEHVSRVREARKGARAMSDTGTRIRRLLGGEVAW
jgi:CheY-like chemotaxis protein